MLRQVVSMGKELDSDTLVPGITHALRLKIVAMASPATRDGRISKRTHYQELMGEGNRQTLETPNMRA